MSGTSSNSDFLEKNAENELLSLEGQGIVCKDEVHDTTPEDMKNFCATQACAQPKDVVSLAEATLATLKTMWDEIGWEKHERDNATAEMFADVKRVFENKLASTQEVKCSINSQIRLTRARISTIETELGQAPSSDVSDSAPHVLREILQGYRGHLDSLEKVKGERAAALATRVEELTCLFNQLDDALHTEQVKFLRIGSDYTLQRIEQLDERVRECKEELARRQHNVQSLIASIRALWGELVLSEEAKNKEKVDSKILEGSEWKMTLANIELINNRCQELEAEKQKRKKASEISFGVLDKLWERIKTPVEERMQVRNSNSSLGEKTLKALEVEISRLEAIKKERMKDLVYDVRSALTDVWQAMRLSEDERQEFAPAYQEIFSDDALLLHEEELERCKERLETMAPLIKLVERRETIRAEESSMKEAQADPSRLLGRGRGMAEKLKMEEKVRHMVSKELPRITDKLRAGIAEYEQIHGLVFRVDGLSVVELLDEEEAAVENAKAQARGRKAASLAAPAAEVRPKTVASASTPSSERPSSSTPASKLKSAAKVLLSANKLIQRTPMGGITNTSHTHNDNTQTPIGTSEVCDAACPQHIQTAVASDEDSENNGPASLLPSSRLKTPRTKLAFEPATTHVISPRTGLPKRMIILKPQE